MELSWPPDGSKSLQDGFKLSLFWLLDRIFAPRSLTVGRRWVYDGSKVAYGGFYSLVGVDRRVLQQIVVIVV